jgi:hypothetical protein
MAADLIDDFLHRLQAHLPEARQVAPQLEAEMRATWGGTERHYIRKRLASNRPEQRTQQLAQALQQGQPLREAFATAGLPARSGFRHLAKPNTRTGRR